jgi:hypothetical protein
MTVRTIIPIGILLFSIGIFAQEKPAPKPESKVEAGFDGMIGLS